MKKTMLAMAFLALSVPALAEIHCTSPQADERLEVRVIDTFLARTAYINRVHPNLEFPIQEVGVKALEKINTVTFVNEEADFELIIDKLFPERRLPPLYRAELRFGMLSAEMKCTID